MAVENLAPCVRQILCGLADVVLKDLQAIIDGQVALLEVQIAQIQQQALQYDILSIPVEIARTAAQKIIEDAKKSAALLPINLIANCTDLGDFTLNIQQSLDVATSVVDDVAFEATRLLSYKEELNALVNELNQAIEQFTDIRDLIDICLAGG